MPKNVGNWALRGFLQGQPLQGQPACLEMPTSGRYIRWREFQQTPTTLEFSPTLLSVLGHAGILHVLHPDYSSTVHAVESATPTHSIPWDAYPPHGTYLATTHRGERTVTIADLCSLNPSPSQFIDTGFEVSEIVLTGNVLLVKGPGAVTTQRMVRWTGFLATGGQTATKAFGKYRHGTQTFWTHRHRAETPAFGRGYYNESKANGMAIGT